MGYIQPFDPSLSTLFSRPSGREHICPPRQIKGIWTRNCPPSADGAGYHYRQWNTANHVKDYENTSPAVLGGICRVASGRWREHREGQVC